MYIGVEYIIRIEPTILIYKYQYIKQKYPIVKQYKVFTIGYFL